MNDSDNNLLPVASETDSELAALDAQDDTAPVPLRKEAATAGLLPADRTEESTQDGTDA